MLLQCTAGTRKRSDRHKGERSGFMLASLDCLCGCATLDQPREQVQLLPWVLGLPLKP
jgi:hypothetical protein